MNTVRALHSTSVPPWAWIVLGAVTATALDLAFAAIYWETLHRVSPATIMQAIAAYWGWGREAYAGGATTAALGAGLFLARMLVLAAIYHAAARRFAVLIERPYTCGALFGLAIYLSNKYIVVPLIGAMPQTATADKDLAWMFSCILAHMLLVGIPLALFSRMASRDE
ncbi:hypothetical protein M2650_07220 [Luteimonas sp. SX5]|uniref:Uncharacterized protein n=1 Tax=Luteimonas galliterrae TaxID=2940486 RepID=A0ABT0MHR9_9GAMM|nr:hypothetical protein [Luteimonas galliterrae]MCL1634421.1 hypothetical protein [Luteimonas galliterrae]